MDGVYLFFGWTFLVASIAFGVGRCTPATDIRNDCGLTGETVIRNTVIKCKPIGSIVDGRRVEFKE